MNDFFRLSLESAAQSDAYVAEVGGLPEIERASADLQVAIGQTREEIATAEFASRFSRELSENVRMWLGQSALSPIGRQAAEEEGEAGLKRTQLFADLNHAEGELARFMDLLVRIRADLKISQQEY